MHTPLIILTPQSVSSKPLHLLYDKPYVHSVCRKSSLHILERDDDGLIVIIKSMTRDSAFVTEVQDVGVVEDVGREEVEAFRLEGDRFEDDTGGVEAGILGA